MDLDKRAENIHHLMGSMMHALRRHHRIVERRVERVSGGLHHSQHRMLMFLSKNGSAASQKDIAEMMNVTPAGVARTLKSLTAAGMVQRAEASRDGRRNEVCLTEKGAQLTRESLQLFRTLDLEMYEGFSDAEIAQLHGLIQRLQRNLEKMDSPEESDS